MSDIEDQSSFRASRSIPTEREDGVAASDPEMAAVITRLGEAIDEVGVA